MANAEERLAGEPRGVGTGAERGYGVRVGKGRELRRCVVMGGPFVPHRSGCDDHLAGRDRVDHGAARSDPQEAAGTAGQKLVHDDLGRAASHTAGNHQNVDRVAALIGSNVSDVRVVSAWILDSLDGGETSGDPLGAPRIAGHQDVAPQPAIAFEVLAAKMDVMLEIHGWRS